MEKILNSALIMCLCAILFIGCGKKDNTESLAEDDTGAIVKQIGIVTLDADGLYSYS